MENIINQLLPTLWAWITSLFSTKRKAAATTGGAAVLAAAFIGPWEGERTEAYLDRVASPPVWTVCYGETRGVKQGDRYGWTECGKMLMDALAEFRDPLNRCIPALPDQPLDVQVALISWSYHADTGAGCSSALAKRANAGRWRDACNELPRWKHASGKVVQGLVNRRAAEQRICLAALGR